MLLPRILVSCCFTVMPWSEESVASMAQPPSLQEPKRGAKGLKDKTMCLRASRQFVYRTPLYHLKCLDVTVPKCDSCDSELKNYFFADWACESNDFQVSQLNR
jgi:hypothetical protein